MKRVLAALLLVCTAACAPLHPVTSPSADWPLTGPAPTAFLAWMTVRAPDGSLVKDLRGEMRPDDPAHTGPYPCLSDPASGRTECQLPAGVQLHWGTSVDIYPSDVKLAAWHGRALTTPDACYQQVTPTPVAACQRDGDSMAGVEVNLIASTPPLPAPPSRDAVLSGHVMFQGLTCDTVDFGVLPWFDAGFFSLSKAGRDSVAACKRAAGDTEVQLLFDNTVGSIYNEEGQPYLAFQSRTFAAHLDEFTASVLEGIRDGFVVKIYLGGENYDNDMALFPIAHQVLSRAGPNGEDLNPYVKYSPGYDGIFYGWEPAKQKLEAFGRLVRSLCPNCYLTMEFNTGHLPQEAGIDMSDYDGFDIEFGDKLQGDNNTYGIVERLIGPNYNRPDDDVPPNDGGDGHPRPWVTKAGTPRGPYYTNCFEWNTYAWVRSRVSAATVEQQRQWLRTIGCGSFTVPISQFRIQLRPAA